MSGVSGCDRWVSGECPVRCPVRCPELSGILSGILSGLSVLCPVLSGSFWTAPRVSLSGSVREYCPVVSGRVRCVRSCPVCPVRLCPVVVRLCPAWSGCVRYGEQARIPTRCRDPPLPSTGPLGTLGTTRARKLRWTECTTWQSRCSVTARQPRARVQEQSPVLRATGACRSVSAKSDELQVMR